MAKYYTTYKIFSSYSAPQGAIAFDFYKSGIFDGFGDCSYYILKIGRGACEKTTFSKCYFAEKEKYICDLISFIHEKNFDTITKEELTYIESDDFYELCRFLNCARFQFNEDYTSIEFKRFHEQFTIDDVGKCKSISGLIKADYSKFNRLTQKDEEYYIGTITLNQHDTSIKIPIINGPSDKVKIKEISSDFNLFKCLCFCLKINLLSYYLYPELCTGGRWLYDFQANNARFDQAIKKFSYYRII